VKHDVVSVVLILSLWQHLLVVSILRMIHFNYINYISMIIFINIALYYLCT
jgi:hypothetical protein